MYRNIFTIFLELLKQQAYQQNEGKDDDEDDNCKGWIDERDETTEWERDELDETVQPVRLLLTKVSTAVSQILG